MNTSGTTFGATKQLARLVEQRLTTLRHLYELCCRQREVIESSDSQRLLKILAAKQRLIAALQAIEERLDPYRSQDPSTRQWETETERRQCQEQLAHCEQIWQEIMSLEQVCEGALKNRRDRIAAELQQAGNAVHAHVAYGGTPTTTSVQLDIHSE